MHDQKSQQGKFQCDICDRDVFLRVWERVMPEEGESCPIVVPRGLEGDPRHRGGDFPDREDVPCLGSAGREEEGRLQEMVDGELWRWQTYRMLAKRSCQGARNLAGMGEACRRRAKRLSAALFLLSGVRYWPVRQENGQMPRSWFGSLRELFLGEQAAACAYRAAAEECRDNCLRVLYLELAAEGDAHGREIRGLIEKA